MKHLKVIISFLDAVFGMGSGGGGKKKVSILPRESNLSKSFRSRPEYPQWG